MQLLSNETEIMQSEEESNCSIDFGDMTALDVTLLMVPRDDPPLWRKRTAAFYGFFYLLLAVYGALFLGLALCCVILLAKKHLAQRYKVRTFIAIDLALVTLGVSRVLFLILDPWEQSGFCTSTACRVFSRLFGALAFPSLTASYTLVFITLWISTCMSSKGRSWIQRPSILIPLCCIHYAVAITIEIIVLLPLKIPVVALSLLIGCEATFSLWGIAVCCFFLVAGCRLLRTVKEAARSSDRICMDSPQITRRDLIEKAKLHINERKVSVGTIKARSKLKMRQERIIRKIALITLTTVVLGMAYSTVNVVYLGIVLGTLFHGCPGLLGDGLRNPEVWLIFRYIFFTLEITLAFMLTYATNDFAPIVNAMRTSICCRFCKLRTEAGPATSSLCVQNTRNFTSSKRLSPLPEQQPSSVSTLPPSPSSTLPPAKANQGSPLNVSSSLASHN